MYYPKNQIQVGLFSNGTLFNPQTGQAYYGYYFATSDGKFFTGKEPNDGTNVQLVSSAPPIVTGKHFVTGNLFPSHDIVTRKHFVTGKHRDWKLFPSHDIFGPPVSVT